MGGFIDPFGAPEYFVDAMKLEEIAPGLIRARMLVHEGGETVLRCTLIMQAHVVPQNMAEATAFMAGQRRDVN